MAVKSSSNASSRYRNFATVVYPESAPENWLEILAEQFVPAFVSPLHDLDVNPTGEVKRLITMLSLCLMARRAKSRRKKYLIRSLALDVK